MSTMSEFIVKKFGTGRHVILPSYYDIGDIVIVRKKENYINKYPNKKEKLSKLEIEKLIGRKIE